MPTEAYVRLTSDRGRAPGGTSAAEEALLLRLEGGGHGVGAEGAGVAGGGVAVEAGRVDAAERGTHERDRADRQDGRDEERDPEVAGQRRAERDRQGRADQQHQEGEQPEHEPDAAATDDLLAP